MKLPQTSSGPVHIIGAGLAGSEAAWQVANAGIKLIDNARFRDVMLKALYKKAQGPQHSY